MFFDPYLWRCSEHMIGDQLDVQDSSAEVCWLLKAGPLPRAYEKELELHGAQAVGMCIRGM